MLAVSVGMIGSRAWRISTSRAIEMAYDGAYCFPRFNSGGSLFYCRMLTCASAMAPVERRAEERGGLRLQPFEARVREGPGARGRRPLGGRADARGAERAGQHFARLLVE